MSDPRTCNEIRSLMADWLDDELSAALRTRVAEHLGACDSCRAAFDQMQAQDGDLALLGAAADRMAEDAARRVRPTQTWRRAWVRAAAVVVLVAGGLYLASERRGGQGPESRVDRTPGVRNRDAVELVPVTECRVQGHTAVALASANPRVRIVWLYEDSMIGEGSTPSSGGVKPRPQG